MDGDYSGSFSVLNSSRFSGSAGVHDSGLEGDGEVERLKSHTEAI